MKKKITILSLLLFIFMVIGSISIYKSINNSTLLLKVSQVHAEEIEYPYHGNIKSKKFHKSTCRYFNCKNCTALFKTREEAIEAGYVPCKICKP